MQTGKKFYIGVVEEQKKKKKSNRDLMKENVSNM